MFAFPPGRSAARARLDAIRPQRYARSRNFLDGAVTRLSPYLRHGVLELAEVRDAVLERVTRAGDAYKLVQELAWRDYWRRIYRAIGNQVHDDLEPYKTGHAAHAYATELPGDIRDGATGLVCIDGFVHDLLDGGYVHNHARMWFASYVVHHRRVAWQAGAAFYLGHLLDGDPASNSLSWQWVASTFGVKPYIFSRENLERYTNGTFCRRCPLSSGGCPFDATYGALDARLFARNDAPDRAAAMPPLHAAADANDPPIAAGSAIVWTHPDALSDANVARRARPDAPVIVAGVTAMAQRDAWDARRLAFVDATAAELRIDRREAQHEDAAGAIVRFARDHRAAVVITVASPDPLLRSLAARISRDIPVAELSPPPFARVERPVALGRFSRYWKIAETDALKRPATRP